MSRVAKKPVALAKGVELNIQAESVSVKGPKGTLSIAKPEGVDVVVENGHAQMSASDASLVPMAGFSMSTLCLPATCLIWSSSVEASPGPFKVG